MCYDKHQWWCCLSIIMNSCNKTLFDLPITSIVILPLLTVLPLLIASHTYCPLLEGEVCLRGVKERVADVSPDRGELSLRH